MSSLRRIDRALLALAVIITRFPFRSHYLYDIDSVNYALALDHFDPSVHQPHPPGYYLYVYLGRLIRLFIHDANDALVAISIGASCVAVVMIYNLAACWWGRRAGICAGLVFLCSPLCWFHGTVALTYILETAFSATVGYLCWRSFCGETRFVVVSAILLGIAAGCRQSSILFLGPLWVLSLRTASVRHIWAGLLALAGTIAAWLFPMLRESGGATPYLSSLALLWRTAVAKETVLDSFVFMSLGRFVTILAIAGLCFGSALLWTFRPFQRSAVKTCDRNKTLFTWVWIGPGLLFFTFVFLRYVNSGYLLILSPPIFAWLGAQANEWYTASLYVQRRNGVAAAMVLANVGTFLYAPIYCSYQSVHNTETKLAQVREDMRRIAPSDDTVIVGFDAHFLGYRQAGYYLPNLLTVEFPAVTFPEGRRVFSMQNRSTKLLGALETSSNGRFLFFPLPEGSEYRHHLDETLKRFPAGALVSTIVNGHEYLGGSSADLPILFPGLAKPYTGVHSLKKECNR